MDVSKMNTTDKVRFILEHVPETNGERNNKLLVLIYWQLFDNIDFPPELLVQLKEEATPPETISRVKRNIREHNRIELAKELSDELRMKLDVMRKEQDDIELTDET